MCKFTCVATIVILSSMSSPVLGAFSGSLDSQTGGLLGTGSWAAGPSSISWTVTELSGGLWQYDYSLTVPSKKIKQVILETSPTLVGADFATFTSSPMAKRNTVKTFSSLSNLPQEVYGLGTSPYGKTRTLDFSFQTAAAPAWGDFYAKGPKSTGDNSTDLALWNSGFLDSPSPEPDPTSGAADGSEEGHILVPGATNGNGGLDGSGNSGVVPEPLTLAGIGLALAAAGGSLVRRRKALAA